MAPSGRDVHAWETALKERTTALLRETEAAVESVHTTPGTLQSLLAESYTVDQECLDLLLADLSHVGDLMIALSAVVAVGGVLTLPFGGILSAVFAGGGFVLWMHQFGRMASQENRRRRIERLRRDIAASRRRLRRELGL